MSYRSVLHQAIVEQAEGLRATRINYRAVLEHDGLMWQKPQNQVNIFCVFYLLCWGAKIVYTISENLL